MNDRKRLVTITTTCYNLHDINLLIVRGMYQNIFLLTVIFAKLFPQKLQHSKSLSLKRLRANWWICTRHSKLACKGHNMYTNQLNINTLPRVKIGWEFVGVNRRQCPNTVHTSIESFFNLIVIVHAIVWMNHNGPRCPNSVHFYCKSLEFPSSISWENICYVIDWCGASPYLIQNSAFTSPEKVIADYPYNQGVCVTPWGSFATPCKIPVNWHVGSGQKSIFSLIL